MYYVVLVLACSLNAAFLATPEHGALCVKFVDSPVQHYVTLEQCRRRAQVIFASMAMDLSQLEAVLPGPYQWSYQCDVPPDTVTGIG